MKFKALLSKLKSLFIKACLPSDQFRSIDFFFLIAGHGNAMAIKQYMPHIKRWYGLDFEDLSVAREGWTALIHAIHGGDVEVVRCLVEAGANINKKVFPSRITPLMWAIKEHNINITEYLVDAGADIHVKDNFGHTALLVAGFQANLDAMQLLLGNGGNINDVDNNGNTVLMAVARQGSLTIIKSLVEHDDFHKIDLFAKNSKGESAFEIAEGNTDIDVYLFMRSLYESVELKEHLVKPNETISESISEILIF